MSFRSQCLLASAMLLALTTAPMRAQQATEIDNVAAFARLYGVARWFYPSDAAANLDWNRFAVDGVRRARTARTPAELETTLKQLFTPLGPGIEIGATLPPKRASTGARNPDLIAWHYRGPGITEGIPGPYSAKRINRSMTVQQTQPNAPTVMAQSISAIPLRGKTVRLRARMRIPNASAPGWAGLWLRVDRSVRDMGFFDNMSDRPVRDTAWREYVIEGKVDADAVTIVFGALSAGMMPVDVDAIDLAVREGGGDWTALPVPDASFELKGSSPWLESSEAAFTRATAGAADGAQFVRIVPPSPAQQTSTRAALPSDSLETPIPGAFTQFALARGLQARVPLSLTDAEARTESPALATLRTELAGTPAPGGRNDTDARLADAIVAWNAFRHFYPYWGDIDVNWDARLRPQLEIAFNAPTTRDAHLDAVRAVVADLNDGHGSARDVVTPPRVAALPLQFRILAGQLVVTASTNPTVPVGSVVTALDGTPA